MRKALATLAVSLLMVMVGGTAAFATVYHNCAQYFICLYQWVNYGSGQWYSSFNNIYQHTNNCLTIPPATWPNGTNVSDNSGSIVVNGDTAGGNVWQHYTLYVFNWVNCNSDGGVDSFNLVGPSQIDDLSIAHYVNVPSISLYHTITSIELIPTA